MYRKQVAVTGTIMPTTQTQDKTLAQIQRQLGGLMAASEQAMYVYVDEQRKLCNANMAEMLGYASPEAWAAAKGGFTEAYVDEESQETLVGAYQDAMEFGTGAAIPVTWKRKGGDLVDTDVLLVPIELDGVRFALHFIEPAGDEDDE